MDSNPTLLTNTAPTPILRRIGVFVMSSCLQIVDRPCNCQSPIDYHYVMCYAGHMARQRIAYKTPPRKLTPKVHKDIITAIDAGLRFVVDWCGYAGISTTTFDCWRELAATDEPGADAARKLFDDIDEAIAKRKARYLLKMQMVGQDDWRMWREMIALVDPKGYGPKAELEISGNQTMQIVLSWGDSDADANHAAETP